MRRFLRHALLFIASFGFSSAFAQKTLPLNTQPQSGSSGSLTVLRRSAERGDAHAQWMLGNVYQIGSVVSQDYRFLSATLHDFGSPRLLTSFSRAARE